MREKITKINDSNFDSLVIFPKKPAVVFLSANWSESSQLICPIFEAAADKYRTKITIYEMDVDENPIIPIAYGIRRIPAVLTFANGQFTESHTGAITEEKLDATNSGKATSKFAEDQADTWSGGLRRGRPPAPLRLVVDESAEHLGATRGVVVALGSLRVCHGPGP